MTKHSRKPPQRRRASNQQSPADDHYEKMLLLDQLESLLEEMEELGVSTRAEIEARIEALHQKLDAAEEEGTA